MFLINKNLKKAQNKEKIIHACYRSYKKKVGTILFFKKKQFTNSKKILTYFEVVCWNYHFREEGKGEPL